VNAFFFGTSAKQLFGAHHPSASRSGRGVVLCNALGREYLLAHPSYRYLAQRLAEDGWHALRFDYYGTGDSAGEDLDATLDQWVEDIGEAINELRESQDLSDITLIGLRAGALLAAKAAQRNEVQRLILWDPVSDGGAYLRNMQHAGRVGEGFEASGVIFSDRLKREILKLQPRDYGAGLPDTVIVNSLPASDSYRSLVAHLKSGGVNCIQEHAPDIPVWEAEWGRAGVGLPVQSLGRIIASLT
jgi:pimeloyl-ACP methyl ester carboxylesterase